jgi:hypothetical protein
MSDPNRFLTERGIDPDGDIVSEQRVERYKGANWQERRSALTAIDPRFGRETAPLNRALTETPEQQGRAAKRARRAYDEELRKMTPEEREAEEALWFEEPGRRPCDHPPRRSARSDVAAARPPGGTSSGGHLARPTGGR